jgi:hypothetical protein
VGRRLAVRLRRNRARQSRGAHSAVLTRPPPVKWDGYRLCVVINYGKATVRTRRGHDWTYRFRPITDAAAELLCRNAVLDGEAVILDAHGRADFAALQDSLSKAVLFVFDLLFPDGRDLRPPPLRERRAALEKPLAKSARSSLLSEQFDGKGEKFLKVARQHGLEGMVSKRIDLPYRSGRRNDWLKIKLIQSDDFLIVGYQPDEHGGITNLKLVRGQGQAALCRRGRRRLLCRYNADATSPAQCARPEAKRGAGIEGEGCCVDLAGASRRGSVSRRHRDRRTTPCVVLKGCEKILRQSRSHESAAKRIGDQMPSMVSGVHRSTPRSLYVLLLAIAVLKLDASASGTIAPGLFLMASAIRNAMS